MLTMVPYKKDEGIAEGLVAQGRTVTETLEIARDVLEKLQEAQAER